MGQLAKDWTTLKTLITQKDDAIERQTAQIAQLQKQVAQQQQAALDADDLKATAEIRQTVETNSASPNESTPKAAAVAPASAAHPPAATSPQPAAAVTTFTK